MKSVAIVVTALFIAATGSAVAADGDQAREQLMQQQREQIRAGANGEKYQEYAKQKREQMQNRYQYRNQIREGSGARMQERMTHRKG